MALALFLLLTLLATIYLGRLLLERRLVLEPTPTITRQPGAQASPTADFRATHNLADLITQIAYNRADAGITTPTRAATATPTHTQTPTPPPPTLEQSATPNSVHVPFVGGENTTATPTATSPTQATPTPLPARVTETAQAAATATALLFTPTSTGTPLPTATPTRPLAASPVATLQAVTKSRVDVYAGPSVLYPLLTQLPENLTVRLEGRTASGEWVHVCCVNDVDGWARQAWFTIRDNKTPDGQDANDPARLALQSTEAVPLTPLPTPTTIPNSNFPLFRRDAAATGRVDARFQGPFVEDVLFRSQATAQGAFSASPIVVGSTVLAVSQDGHIYSFSKDQGNQRWRKELNTVIPFAPAVQDASIYVINESGLLFALRDTGSAADALQWQRATGVAPTAPLNVYGDILLLSGKDHVLYLLNRLDAGNERRRFSAPHVVEDQSVLSYPAVGDQLVYVGDKNLHAVDVYSATVAWSDPEVNVVTAAPVYARPGVRALAEVYVGDRTGRLHAFDANTGASLWRTATGRQWTALAVDETTLYAWATDFVSAWNRETGAERWTRFVSGAGALGGPLIGNGRILVAATNNNVLILDAATGNVVSGLPSSPPLVGSPAVSDGQIILAGQDGQLYKFKEAN